MAFNDRLKMARKNKGYSQKQLAELVGVANTAISNYEKSISFPNTDILYKLFDVLDVDPNYLFWDDLSDKIKKKILVTEPNTSHYSELLSAYRAHPEMQPAINKMLDISSDGVQRAFTATLAEQVDNAVKISTRNVQA